MDAVHYAPHGLIDVQALDCDFLACSVYKFFGPHTGVPLRQVRRCWINSKPTKCALRPARPPGKWETGTQSFESLAGVAAAVDYWLRLGGSAAARGASD